MLINITKILSEQNRSVYWLAKELNCDYQSIKRLVNNQTSKISFELLEAICNVLDCTPNDILQIEEYDKKSSPF